MLLKILTISLVDSKHWGSNMSPTERNLRLNKAHTLLNLKCQTKKKSYKIVSCNFLPHNLWVS